MPADTRGGHAPHVPRGCRHCMLVPTCTKISWGVRCDKKIARGGTKISWGVRCDKKIARGGSMLCLLTPEGYMRRMSLGAAGTRGCRHCMLVPACTEISWGVRCDKKIAREVSMLCLLTPKGYMRRTSHGAAGIACWQPLEYDTDFLGACLRQEDCKRG